MPGGAAGCGAQSVREQPGQRAGRRRLCRGRRLPGACPPARRAPVQGGCRCPGTRPLGEDWVQQTCPLQQLSRHLPVILSRGWTMSWHGMGCKTFEMAAVQQGSNRLGRNNDQVLR